MMLSIHETEEIYIGDKTPFDNISEQEKNKIGEIAVEKVFDNLSKKDIFIKTIDEFNKRETPEAIFAYLCDKMECDLQAKKYCDEGRFQIENVSDDILKDERIQSIISSGATTVAEIFIEYDKKRYKENEIFSDMIKFLKQYYTKNKNYS